MTALIAIHKSPLSLEPERTERVPSGQTLSCYLQGACPSYDPEDEDQPVLIHCNGYRLSVDAWSEYEIQPGDFLDVRPRPQGLVIAATILAVIAVTAVTLALVDIPDVETPDIGEQSPTYSADIQVNRARLGSPIPDRYGRRRFAPDIAHDRYREYEGNDEYWYLLLSIGHGSYQYHGVYIGETSIDNFDDVTYQFFEPGQQVTLFPTAIYSASEVDGQGITLFGSNEDDYTGPAGPYVANLADSLATELAVDIDFPGGLGSSNDDGGIDSVTVNVEFLYREIDSNGDPVGDGTWSNLLNKSYSGRTFDRLRYTEKIVVSPGRYEVRGERTNSASSSHRVKDEVRWTGLRSYLQDDNTFNHSTLAIKIRSSAQLSAQSERRVLVDCTRMLPVHDGTQWLPAQPTRNAAWAFCNIIKSEYGGDYSDANLILDEIVPIAQGCDARGDYFDGHFDVAGTLWANLQQVASSIRALPVLLGSRYTMVRDEPKVADVYHFSARHIVKDSSTLRYRTLDHWGDDSVEIEYTDPQTWKPAHITAAVPGSTASKPKKVKMPWITDATQAHREAMFMAAKQAWRTRYLDFKTELDGRLLRPLSQLLVVQEFVEWGQSGDVLHQAGQVLTLSEPPVFQEAGEHYIWLRDRRGRSNGAYQVFPVAGYPDKVEVTDPLPAWIYTEGVESERTAFAFGSAELTPRQMLLERGNPSGNNQFSLTAVLDDPRVHQYDALINDGTIATPDPVPPQTAVDLRIRSVRVTHGGTATAPVLRIVWNPVADAKRYFVDISSDGVSGWQRAYTGELPVAQLTVPVGTIHIRIAAQDDVIGDWYVFSVEAGAGFDLPDTPSGLQLSESFTGRTAKFAWQTDITAVAWFVEVVDVATDSVRISRDRETPDFELGVAEALLNGLSRQFKVLVYGVNTNNVRSVVPAELTVKNDQMPVLNNLRSVVSYRTLHVLFDAPTQSDFEGLRVWMSDTAGFDPGVTPYFDQLDPLRNRIDIPLEQLQTVYLKVAAFDAWGRDELTLSAEFSDVASGIRESDLNQVLQDRIDLIDTPTTGLIDRLLAEELARSGADTNLQSQIDSLEVSNDVPIYIQPNEPTGQIEENSRWFDSDDGNRPYIYQSGVWVDVTNQRILDNEAAITTEQSVRAGADSALALRADQLEATVDDPVTGVNANRASIVAESAARASADDALSLRSDALEATVNDPTTGVNANRALIVSEQSVRADADIALADDINTLDATVNDPATGVAAAHSAVQTEQTARASADDALAQSIGTVQTTVNGHTVSIQTNATTLGNVEDDVLNLGAEYTLRLDNDGYVIGYGAYNDGPGASGFVFRADQFAFGHPSTPNMFPLLIVGNELFIDSARVTDLDVSQITGDVASFVNASITVLDVAKLTGNKANFISANMGDATVTTLKIAGDAVTARAYAERDAPTFEECPYGASIVFNHGHSETVQCVVTFAVNMQLWPGYKPSSLSTVHGAQLWKEVVPDYNDKFTSFNEPQTGTKLDSMNVYFAGSPADDKNSGTKGGSMSQSIVIDLAPGDHRFTVFSEDVTDWKRQNYPGLGVSYYITSSIFVEAKKR